MSDMMPPKESPLRRSIENSIRLVLIVILVPFMVVVDLAATGNRLRDHSLTEWSQALMLLVCAALFARAARRRPHGRGWYLLVCGFYLCCLIRELDWVFDRALYHGAWFPFAVATAIVVVVRALHLWRTLLPGAEEFVGTQAFVYVQVGLVVVLFFSRLLGSGRLIWFHIGLEQSLRLTKSIVQESLESLGYLLNSFGAIHLHREFDREHL
ncbi:MAG: hypothetical protein ACOX9C_09040 [Kiritimatiellia bacterium]|jgi:hypothetical protein